MTQPVNNARRNLLRGLSVSTASPVRPPGALCESEFTSACTACGQCVSACPEGIIISGSGGYPEINFRHGECTFCCECVSACPEPALNRDVQPLWQLRLRVEERCLAKHRIVCQACADICDQQAIRFRPRLNNVAKPEIDHQDCNGCGACVSVCPEDALVLQTVRAVTSSEGVASHG